MTRFRPGNPLNHPRLEPAPGARVIRAYDAINFAPCNCTIASYVGVPVVPVEVIAGKWDDLYRCLNCGEIWDRSWLEKRTAEVHRRVG